MNEKINIMPDMNELIAPRLTKVVQFIGNLLKQVPYDIPLCQSDHYHGAAALLDSHLDETL